jgi:hypothetical protein
MGTLVALQIEQIVTGSGFGDPRYFTMAVVFATIGVLWIASTHRTALGRVWNGGLVALLVVGGCTGSYSLTSGRVTHVEGECAFFQYGVAQVLPVLGRTQTGKYACVRPNNRLEPSREADSWLSRHIHPDDRVLADNESDFPAVLFTSHADQFVVRNDRDWQKIVADPTASVTYIMTQATSASGSPDQSPNSPDEGAAIVDANPAQWKLEASFAGFVNTLGESTWVQVWHYDGAPQNG